MEHGKQHGHAIPVDAAQHQAAAFDIVQKVAVGKHGAFRPPRGAGGVNNHRQVALIPLRRVGGFFSKRTVVQLLDLQALQVWPARQQGRHALPQRRVGDQHIHPGVIEQGTRPRWASKIIDRHRHPAGISGKFRTAPE